MGGHRLLIPILLFYPLVLLPRGSALGLDLSSDGGDVSWALQGGVEGADLPELPARCPGYVLQDLQTAGVIGDPASR